MGTDRHRIEIRCFGLLRVEVHGSLLNELERSPALRNFLGYLILHRKQTLSRSQVAGCFWPEVPEAKARRALNNLLWRLQQLDDGRLTSHLHTNRHTLRWELPPDTWLDLEAFETITAPFVNRKGETAVIHKTRLLSLQQAVALYQDQQFPHL